VNTTPNALARSLRRFLTEHMSLARALSPNTVRSYRDTLVLLLRFLSTRTGRPVVALDLPDLDAEGTLAFLDDLEARRRNCAATRNVRLAAIHAFARFVASQHPEYVEAGQRLLSIPFKRTQLRVIEYLETEELRALLAAPDRTTLDGDRDYALFLLMFNTGGRVQEILDVRPSDLQLVRPYQVRLMGKGRKERLCPLWPQTASTLRDFLQRSRLEATSAERLFRNQRGEPLTRFGVRYLFRKYAAQASSVSPGLAKKRVHPHTMRHTSAVHLLQSGVDLVTISQWLGHASVNTTNRYAVVDLETRRAALSKACPVGGASAVNTKWRDDASILAWLEAL